MSQLQADFDFVWNAITEQGRPAELDDRCALLAPDGARCAIGHLLSSAELSSIIFEAGGNWRRKGVMPKRFQADVGFYERLQAAHDGAAAEAERGQDFVFEFQREMLRIAADFGLQVPAKQPSERDHVERAIEALGEELAAPAARAA